MKRFKLRKVHKSTKRSLLKIISLVLGLFLLTGSLGACKKDDGTDKGSSTSSPSKVSSSGKASSASSSKTSTASSSKTTGTAPAKSTSTNQHSDTGNNTNLSSNADNTSVQQTNQQQEAEPSSDTGDQPADNITEELKMDLGGKNIVFSVWEGYRNMMGYDFMPDARESDVGKVFLNRISDAEKRYNFKLEIREANPYTQRDDFITNSLAGVYYADVLATQSRFAYPKFIKGSMIYPVDEYYDFNADPVWSGNSYFRSGCSWGGRYYGITGAVTGYGSGVVFNRDNMEKEGYPDLQDMVANGQWTWETMLDMSIKNTRDINGDGVIDTYGILAGSLANGIVYSNGGRFLDFRSDNSIKFGLASTNSIKALQFVADLYNVYKVVKNKASGGAGLVDFENVLFYFGDFGQITYLRDMNYRAGFAPYPKGPDVTDYQNVSIASNIIVFSNQTQYKKELVRIFADAMATWDPSRLDYLSSSDITAAGFKERVMDERDLNCIVKYAHLVQFDLIRGFDGFESDVSKKLFNPVTSGSMPVASAIEAYTNVAQSLIDSQN